MKQAPVLILVVNPLASGFDKALSNDEKVSDICNAQSIGAAIEQQNLLVA